MWKIYIIYIILFMIHIFPRHKYNRSQEIDFFLRQRYFLHTIFKGGYTMLNKFNYYSKLHF